MSLYNIPLAMKEIVYLDLLMHPTPSDRAEPITNPNTLADLINDNFRPNGVSRIEPREIELFQESLVAEREAIAKKRTEIEYVTVMIEDKKIDRRLNLKKFTAELNRRLGYSEESALSVQEVRVYVESLSQSKYDKSREISINMQSGTFSINSTTDKLRYFPDNRERESRAHERVHTPVIDRMTRTRVLAS